MIYFWLIIIGFALRLQALIGLKNNWSLELKTPDKIITTGIYKYMRHPSYLGTILIISGLTFWNVRIAIIYFAVVFFLARIIEEEKILKQSPQYREYQRKTGSFYPKFWRSS